MPSVHELNSYLIILYLQESHNKYQGKTQDYQKMFKVNTSFNVLGPLCSQTIGEQLKLYRKRKSVLFLHCWELKFPTFCVPREYNLPEWEVFRIFTLCSHSCILHFLNHNCLSGTTSLSSLWIINVLHDFLKHTAMWFTHPRARLGIKSMSSFVYFHKVWFCDTTI